MPPVAASPPSLGYRKRHSKDDWPRVAQRRDTRRFVGRSSPSRRGRRSPEPFQKGLSRPALPRSASDYRSCGIEWRRHFFKVQRPVTEGLRPQKRSGVAVISPHATRLRAASDLLSATIGFRLPKSPIPAVLPKRLAPVAEKSAGSFLPSVWFGRGTATVFEKHQRRSGAETAPPTSPDARPTPPLVLPHSLTSSSP